MTIYQCKQEARKNCTPRQWDIVHEATSERDAIKWLEQNGGGTYCNILHNFQMKVLSDR